MADVPAGGHRLVTSLGMSLQRAGCCPVEFCSSTRLSKPDPKGSSQHCPEHPKRLEQTCVLSPCAWRPEERSSSLWEVSLATASSPCILLLQARHKVQW